MKKYITGDLLHYKICNANYLCQLRRMQNYCNYQ